MADKLKATLSAGMALKASLTAGTGTQTIEFIEKDYNNLINKPTIGGTELVGDITLEDVGYDRPEFLTNSEIENLINSIT